MNSTQTQQLKKSEEFTQQLNDLLLQLSSEKQESDRVLKQLQDQCEVEEKLRQEIRDVTQAKQELQALLDKQVPAKVSPTHTPSPTSRPMSISMLMKE